MQLFDRIFGSSPRIHLTMLSMAVLVYFIRVDYAWASLGLPEGAHLTLAFYMLGCWAIIALWSLKSLGRKIGLSIMKSGPYKYVRNPLYTAEIFFGWLAVLFAFNTWLAIPAMIITFYLAHYLIQYEEKLMDQQFGDEWRLYRATTPSFFPRVRLTKNPRT